MLVTPVTLTMPVTLVTPVMLGDTKYTSDTGYPKSWCQQPVTVVLSTVTAAAAAVPL
jgi:hypothetical protein